MVQELVGQQVFVLLEVPLVLCLTVLLLNRYASGHGSIWWFVVGISWFVSLLTPALLSLDISETLASRCRTISGEVANMCPAHTADADTIRTAWFVIYWLSFCMSWFVLPIFASYSISGAFGPLKKLRSALRDRLVLWGCSVGFMVLCAGFLIYQFNLTWFALMGVLESLVNTFGLLVVIVMLGHGLVEVPWELWQNAEHETQIKKIENRVTELMERLEDARAGLATVIGQVEAMRKKFAVARLQYTLEESKQLSTFLSIVEAEVPVSDETFAIPPPIPTELPHEVSEEALEQLRRRLKTRVIEFRKANSIWQSQCQKAFDLQDVMQWKASFTYSDLFGRSTSVQPTVDRSTHVYFLLRSFAVPVVLRLVAIVGLGLSTLVSLAEITVWTIRGPIQVSLSPFDWIIHIPGNGVLFLQFFSFGLVSYMALCTFYSLFRFKLFHVYELVSQHTDVYTLFLNAMMCCRVAPVLAYNFLTIIHETNYAVDLLFGTSSPRTAFSLIETSMEEIPVFGVGFNLYGPALLLIFIILNLTGFWSYVLRRFGGGFLKLAFDGSEDAEECKRGKRLLLMERRRLSRRNFAGDLPEELSAFTYPEDSAKTFDIEDIPES